MNIIKDHAAFRRRLLSEGARYEKRDAADMTRLADTIDRFVDAQWQHLSTEEKLILPAAQRHLTDADWLAIEAAFRANGELRRGGPQDEAYKRLFTRLMNLAAERRAA